MVSVSSRELEMYFPTDEDLMDMDTHGEDCECISCSHAKSSRFGSYYNGQVWVEIL